MFDQPLIPALLGLVVVGTPLLLVLVLGLSSLFDRPLPERTTGHCVQLASWVGLVASLAILAWMLSTDARYVPIEPGNWVAVEHEHAHYHFEFKFVFDRL